MHCDCLTLQLALAAPGLSPEDLQDARAALAAQEALVLELRAQCEELHEARAEAGAAMRMLTAGLRAAHEAVVERRTMLLASHADQVGWWGGCR